MQPTITVTANGDRFDLEMIGADGLAIAQGYNWPLDVVAAKVADLAWRYHGAAIQAPPEVLAEMVRQSNAAAATQPVNERESL